MVREVISVREAAQRAGVHRDTLYAAIKQGRLNGVLCHGVTMVYSDEIARFAVLPKGRPRKQTNG